MIVTKEGKVIKKDGNPYKTFINNNGYECLKITRKHYLIHRLVAKEYCIGYSEGLVVNHKDGNRLNNHYTNLEWVTTKENVQDAINRGTFNIHSAHEVAWKNHKKKTIAILPNGIQKRYDSTKEAALDNNCSPAKATLVCKGKRRHTKGIIFIYDIV